MFEWVMDPNAWLGLLTLTALEAVLGIDNIVFISILAGKLPREQQPKARFIGLSLALFARIVFLLSITWIMRLTRPLFTVATLPISGKSLILILGGLFLMTKATFEIHEKLEGEEKHGDKGKGKGKKAFASVVAQIVMIDLVFSIDSVVTAVGMVQYIGVMITAVVISIILMLLFSGAIADFINGHPTIKMLALSFLVLIGVNLLAEGFGQHIPRGYTYFAMAFSLGVEMLNLRLRGHTHPVHLHEQTP